MEVFMKKTRKKKYRRSDDKIITKEAGVLKHLRETRKLSLRKVGLVIGKSATWVSHVEHGRIDLDPKKIFRLLNIYGYSYEDFMELVNGNRAKPINTFAECVEILKRLDRKQLKTVKAILESF
jgi:transcriptional regulator with XRE-family HTH domain